MRPRTRRQRIHSVRCVGARIERLGRYRLRLAAVLALALIAAAAAVAPFLLRGASAHASLISASPANNETVRRPPARITLHFSEAIERKLTEIQVKDKDGNRFDDGATAFDDKDSAFASVGVKTLAPGLYFVRWSNVSAVDGHPYDGSYPFIVLNADGTFPAGIDLSSGGQASTSGGSLFPGKLDGALKWIALLSIGLVAGAAFMFAAAIRPGAAFLEDDDYQRVTEAAERWVVNLAHVLLPAAFIASAILVLLTVNRFGTSTGLVEYLTSLRTGRLRLAQLIFLVVALAGADLLFLGGSLRKRNAGLALLIAASLGAMFTSSLVSHSANNPGKVWGVTSDFVHFAASSAWLGALVMLIPLFRRTRHQFDETRRFLFLANAFDRFSIIAGLSVIAILVTGTFNGLAQVPTAGAMIHTAYGQVLLTKIGLVLPLLAVAAVNAFWLKPLLVSAIDALYQQGGDQRAATRMRCERQIGRLQRVLPRTIAVEIVLIVAVFGIVGVLSQTSTAKGQVAAEKAAQNVAVKFSQTATTGGIKLTLEVSPNRVGLNQYNLTILNADGSPSTTVTQARLRFNYDEVQNAVAPSEIILTRFADGDYRGAGAYFSQPGNWRVEANIRRSDADDATQLFVLPVARAAATAQTGQGGAFELPFTVFGWNQVAGALLALAGGVIVLYRRQLRWLQQPGYRAGMAIATALMLAGAVLVFGVHTHDTAAVNPGAGNPVRATADSVARGKMLFQQNCIQCHGIDGRGDGPEAASLSPAPTDFRQHMPLHTDPQFKNFIAEGYPGSAMPKFKDAFSDDDMWNLVNYLRSAFTEGASQ